MNDVTILPDAGNASIAPDFGHACAHVRELTGNDPNIAVVDIRLLHDKDKSTYAINLRGTITGLWSQICQHQSNGYGVFITLAFTNGVGVTNLDIISHSCSVADLDSIDADQQRDLTNQWEPAPTYCINTSPGRFHAYWSHPPYFGPAAFTEVQRKLAAQFNGDPACVDPARIMRLAGSIHLKGTPHLVTMTAMRGWGTRTDHSVLAASLAHVAVPIVGSGQRQPLGTPSLAAPSIPALQTALDTIEPNAMDRSEWIATMSAVKQAGNTLTDDATLFSMWSTMCERYDGNDPAENLKEWLSIKDTQLGWPSLLRRVPNLLPTLMFKGEQHILPVDKDVLFSSTQKPSGNITELEIIQIVTPLAIPIGLNTFNDRIERTGDLPWQTRDRSGWTDTDDVYFLVYMQNLGYKPSAQACKSAIRILADRQRFNPVTDMLDGLVWDRVPRIDRLFTQYFNATNAEFAAIVSAKFMLSLVARAYQPGCKVDTMVVLEGTQGIYKSTALNVIFGDDFFSDQIPNMKDKEGTHHLLGRWGIEIAELSALKRSEVEEVKSFITSRVDRYRPPYGHHEVERPRTCVFVATTNDTEYLKDETGNRRFWPVSCGMIDIVALRADRDQLLAEAVHRYRAGERWWLEGSEAQVAAGEQAERVAVDPWFDKIATYCAALSQVQMAEVVSLALVIPYQQHNAQITGRAAKILRQLGFLRKKTALGPLYVR